MDGSRGLGKQNFIDYFKEHVRTQPDKVCLVDPLNREALVGTEPEQLTYRELAGPSTRRPRPHRPGNQEGRYHHGPAAQCLGAGHALPRHHPGRRPDFTDAHAVALSGTRLHRRHDRCGGHHHRRRFQRFQARGDGREAPGQAPVAQADPHPDRDPGDVEG